jgi:hypothetical protein
LLAATTVGAGLLFGVSAFAGDCGAASLTIAGACGAASPTTAGEAGGPDFARTIEPVTKMVIKASSNRVAHRQS